MEIQGQIISILQLQTGQGSKGAWHKQEFILETPGQYPKKIAMSLWGEENINKYDLEVGLKITAHINLESREYNGRWYTEVRVWKVESDSQRRSAPQAQSATPGPGIDDLPF